MYILWREKIFSRAYTNICHFNPFIQALCPWSDTYGNMVITMNYKGKYCDNNAIQRKILNWKLSFLLGLNNPSNILQTSINCLIKVVTPSVQFRCKWGLSVDHSWVYTNTYILKQVSKTGLHIDKSFLNCFQTRHQIIFNPFMSAVPTKKTTSIMSSESVHCSGIFEGKILMRNQSTSYFQKN